MFEFDEFLSALADDVFEEMPVEIEEFVTSKEFLGLPPLSKNQYVMIKASTQVYKLETLIQLHGEEEGRKIHKQTCSEVIFQLGKGSGKDYVSTIACAFVVYRLLCLKDPARYFGKPTDDAIDIINIAINAEQAKKVFFNGFLKRIKNCPWFSGKYDDKVASIAFPKSIAVHSGHSQRESFEGYNVIMVILDEISGFELESTTGNSSAKTAEAIYKMYRQSVTSRFPSVGKIILLSFPRFKNDYIQQRYNQVVAEKEVVIRSHTFKKDMDLPNGIKENEFVIEWEEDHITHYNTQKVFALKRPTWEINPTIKIDDLAQAFYDDPIDSLSRFACMPPDAVDAFFKSREKIEAAFVQKNGVDDKGAFENHFVPDEEKEYFVHVDLAQKHDHCAVALAHIDHWVTMKIAGQMKEASPKVVVDAVRWWTPTKDKSVDFADVRDYILELRHRGFNIKLVTFDRWNSHDMMQQMIAYGMKSEILSVAKKHYDDMQMVVVEERLAGPKINLLIEELLQLRIIKDKVDHPRKGSKDLSDAVCGAIYNAVSGTARNANQEVKVYDYASYHRETEEDYLKQNAGIIRMPESNYMPDSIRDYLAADIPQTEEQGFIDNFSIL